MIQKNLNYLEEASVSATITGMPDIVSRISDKTGAEILKTSECRGLNGFSSRSIIICMSRRLNAQEAYLTTRLSNVGLTLGESFEQKQLLLH
jgi:hypothetical protein